MTAVSPAAPVSALSPEGLRDFIVAEARRLGFHRVGLVPVEPPARYDAYRSWLARGYAGTMTYLAAPDRVAARRDLRCLAADARTVVVVALAYGKHGGDTLARGDDAIRGTIARYARGRDYHAVMKRRLAQLAEGVSRVLGRAVAARPCVDTAPILERDLAERAGVGFTAKNTMLIAPGLGSFVLLGELLLDVDAAPTSAAPSRLRCGRCRTCLDACPTGAFADPYVLDARRCISYLTIEHRGWIPQALRPAMGTMVFGCDICQEVCPFNAAAPERNAIDPELAPLDDQRGVPDLLVLLEQGASRRRRYLHGTALRRVNREQLLRNVCVALGNAGDKRAIPALAAKLADPSPIVRGHAAWALGRLGAGAICERALASETDPDVAGELRAALQQNS